MKLYPRIGHKSKLKRAVRICAICKRMRADLEVTIQINALRASDVSFLVHSGCIGPCDAATIRKLGLTPPEVV